MLTSHVQSHFHDNQSLSRVQMWSNNLLMPEHLTVFHAAKKLKKNAEPILTNMGKIHF